MPSIYDEVIEFFCPPLWEVSAVCGNITTLDGETISSYRLASCYGSSSERHIEICHVSRPIEGSHKLDCNTMLRVQNAPRSLCVLNTEYSKVFQIDRIYGKWQTEPQQHRLSD